MPIKLAKTHRSKPNSNSHLTSLPLFHATHENKQSKLSGYLSAAVPCCFVSLILVDMHRAGASNSKVKSVAHMQQNEKQSHKLLVHKVVVEMKLS